MMSPLDRYLQNQQLQECELLCNDNNGVSRKLIVSTLAEEGGLTTFPFFGTILFPAAIRNFLCI
jgi:hypothetical protein